MKREISLTIKPTDACNMRCKHCYHAAEGFDNNLLSIECIKKYINLAAQQYQKINVLFHGGEPTIAGKEYFSEIFEYEHSLEKRDIIFTNTLQTNGLLLDDFFCDILQQNKVNLGISFDGPNNSILRQNTERVLNNIQYLKKREYKFAILCVETKQTIIKLVDTYEWFKHHEMGYKIIPIFNYGNAKYIEDLVLDARTYAEEMIRLYKYWLMDKECNIRVNTLEEFTLLFCPNYSIHFGQGCICHRLAINPDGRIFPCGRPYSDEFFLGHINDVESISNIFSTENYKKLINISSKRFDNCKKECRYHTICRGGCISNSILDGSFEQINGEACKRSKYLFENIEKINQKLYSDIANGREGFYNPRAIKRITKYLKNCKK